MPEDDYMSIDDSSPFESEHYKWLLSLPREELIRMQDELDRELEQSHKKREAEESAKK